MPTLYSCKANFRFLFVFNNINRIFLGLFLCSLVPFSANAQTQPTAFDKSFTPATIGPGATSTLILNISSGSVAITDISFTDIMPAGISIINSQQATNSCGGIITIDQNTGTITLSEARLGSNESCAITVFVTSNVAGPHTNISGDLNYKENGDPATIDGPSADLTVDNGRPGFSKSFSPGVISPKGTSTLTFTVDNGANGAALTQVSFTDILPAGLAIAEPSNASTDCESFPGTANFTAVPGSNSISLFANGSTISPVVAVGGSCTVEVDVTATEPGLFLNVSGDLTTGSVVGSGISSGMATSILSAPSDVFSKIFTNDPVSLGGQVTLEFTVNNVDDGDNGREDVNGPFSSIAFSDNLNTVVTGLTVNSVITNTCGGSVGGSPTQIDYSGGSLDPGMSCTVEILIDVDASTATGSFTNTTDPITYIANGNNVTGNAATDQLLIRPQGPVFTKIFLDDPVIAGQNTTLEFTISNPTTNAMTDIAFEDIFDNVLIDASSVPTDGSCGANSVFTFTPLAPVIRGSAVPAKLVMSEGSLDPGGDCTFSITLETADDAPPGIYPNKTSDITASAATISVTGDPAKDDLVIAGAPDISKVFTDDPVAPGGQVTLEFTITHRLDAQVPATAITFTDDLDAVLTGLAATGLPAADVCGTGSQLSGTSFLTLTGGNLAAGEACTFTVTLDVPAGASSGTYNNKTSALTATVSGSPTSSAPAVDDLQVGGLIFSKSFDKETYLPGSSGMLTFTIDNIGVGAVQDATSISFQDDLDDIIPTGAGSDITSTSGTLSDVCGDGSQISGTSNLIFSGGSLEAGTSCSFTINFNIPSNVDDGLYFNTTTAPSATINGDVVGFRPATDNIQINSEFIDFTKTFMPDLVAPGGTSTLEFTITNLDPDNALTDIAFTDNLNAALSGLVSTAGTLNDICGTGSQLSGTSVLNFTAGTLSANGSCTFSVPVSIPANAAEGSVNTNTTSVITGTIGAASVFGSEASDVLTVGTIAFSVLAEAGPQQTINCASSQGVDVTLDGSTSLQGLAPTLFTWSEGLTILNPTSKDNPVINLTGVTPGMHKYKLEVRDDAGNKSSDMVVVMVNADLVPPVVTLNGNATETVECGTAYVDPGATANDACDGSLNVIVTGTVNSGVPGTYMLTYTATDANNNMASKNRTVTVEDTTPPSIDTPASDQTVECDGAGNTAQLNAWLNSNGGAAASDACGGVSWSNDFSSLSDDCGATGSVTVIFTATDDNNLASTTAATFTIVDTTPPTINTCPSSFPICFGEIVSLPSPTASDNCDNTTLDMSNDAPNQPFPLGPTIVTWTITDDCGNSTTCQYTVNVLSNPEVSISESDAPEFCQGALVELTASPSGATYNWSTGDETESILVGNGIYDVTVTESTGCTGTASYTVDFDPEDLLSAYIILAQEEVDLDHDQTILNGGVGVFEEDKKIKLDHNSTITGPTTFAIASEIEIKNGSEVTNPIIGQPIVTLPAFKTNEDPEGEDIKVLEGTTMYLNETSYKKVEVEEDATAIFTQSIVLMEEFKTKKRATVEVADCSELIIEKDFKIDEDSDFNPDSRNVVVYAEKADIKKGSDVIADIYVSNDIKADGDDEQPITMTGLFIAGKKVEGDHFVTWNWKTNCDCEPTESFAPEPVKTLSSLRVDPDIILSAPNPFSSSFTITGNLDKFEGHGIVRIIDISSKEVFSKKIASKNFSIDVNSSDWAPGVYYIIATTDKNNKTLKVIKIE